MNTRILQYTCSFLLYILFSTESFGQQPGQNPNQDPGLSTIGSSVIRDTTESEILPLDTPVTMFYTNIEDPDRVFAIKDSFLWSDNHHLPLSYFFAHLGNYGSAARSISPAINFKTGFATGWDQYDPYYVHADSFRYYHQSVPVLKAKYSQASQKDTYISLQFGRSFAKGISLSLSYDKINQEGEFARQHQKNTGLGIGVWHNAPSGRYDAFYNYISNTAIAEESGGISAPELINDTQGTPLEFVPVFLSGALTTHKYRSFITKQIFHLISDSLNPGIDLWFQGQVASDLYKFSDPDTVTAYYTSLFQKDNRGLRQFTSYSDVEFNGGISVPWKKAHSILNTWLRYRQVDLNQEPEQRNINELYLNAAASFQWIEPLLLKGHMSFGLAQAEGNYMFQAQAVLNTGILGKIEGIWNISSRNPYLIESRLFVNQQLIYDFQYQNPFITEFGVGWNWEKQNLHASIKWMVFDNYIFFNNSRLPEQLQESFSLRKVNIRKDFDLKWIGVKTDIIWQPDAREELAIPDLLYSASLYGRIKLFKKKLTVMPGIDVTHHNGYAGVSYFPVTGRYHLTGDEFIPDYLRIDAALGIRINFLKAFVRMEDIVGLWEDRVLYQADFYPHFPGYFRIGLATGFYN